MKLLKIVGVLVVLAGATAAALVLAPEVYGSFGARLLAQGRPFDSAQGRPAERERSARSLMSLARGGEIGVRIAEGPARGVVIEEVEPDTPAEKAGLKRGDIIVEFDGEHVRGVRQFSRLVGETPPGRSVTATIEREGQKKDVQITTSESRGAGILFDGDYLRGFRADLDRLGDHLPFDFSFDVSGAQSGRRLGVTVNELTDQLAQYFGAKEGVLIASVADGSTASRAGLKAGDVITSVNGRSIRSREDLTRSLRDAENAELTIAFVRDKKESTVKATMDPPRRTLRGLR